MEILDNIFLIAGLVPLAWIDMKEKKIPNKNLLFMLSMYFVLISLKYVMESMPVVEMLMDGAGGMLAGLLPGLVCYLLRKSAIGGGDVKLMALMGLYLGWEAVLEVLLLSLLFCFIYHLKIIFVHKKTEAVLPFAPFLLAGAVGMFMYQYIDGQSTFSLFNQC